MTALSLLQLLTFVAMLAAIAYAAVAPKDANPDKRSRRTRLYAGYALLAAAAFSGSLAADQAGWVRSVLGVAALILLVGGLSAVAKYRNLGD